MPNEKVAVILFQGTMLENYFYHPTVDMKKPAYVPMRTVYTCENGCSRIWLI